MRLSFYIRQNTPSQGDKPVRFQMIARLPAGFLFAAGALNLYSYE